MAKILLPNTVNEAEFNQYVKLRDAPRNVISYGVYPNCIKCLQEYDILNEQLESNLSELQEYHDDITAAVTPYIEQLQTHMTAIVDIIQSIESVKTGMFNIS